MTYSHRFSRRFNTRVFKKVVLILCEGEKTEPNYFREFPFNKGKYFVKVEGEGSNTVSLVEDAVNRKNEAIKSKTPYHKIWCVFDKDDFDDKFNVAIELARKNGIECAYSNESFELWYVLHYEYSQSALKRDAYCHKLTTLLQAEGRGKYKKNRDDIYKILESKQSVALRNAKKLLSDVHAKGLTPVQMNPCTTVCRLVEELQSFDR